MLPDDLEKQMTPPDAKRPEDDLPNFRDKSGQLFLMRCHKCDRENYAPMVPTGQCAWCGWNEEKP